MTDSRQRTTQRVTLVGALVNSLLALGQIVVGLIGQSQALLADGLHTLSDLVSDFVVFFASYQAGKSADENHPYGHGRIETLASVGLGVALVLVGLGIGYRGVISIYQHEQILPEPITLLFAVLAILSKEFLYRYTLAAARTIHSRLLETNAWHHRSDALSSIVVLIGISGQMFGIAYMDAAAAIVVAGMIGMMGLRLGRKALDELIDTSLEPALVEQIRQTVEGIEGVREVRRLRSRSMGGLGYIDAEILVNPRLTVSEAHHISINTEHEIKQAYPQIADITLHVDPLQSADHSTVGALPARGEVLFKLYSIWEEISGSGLIRNIHLHYLNDRIEVDIILPLECASNDTSLLQQDLERSARDLPYIGAVTFYYQH